MATGTITKSIIDSLVIESGLGLYPWVIHISGEVYACVYAGPGNDGWLKTFSVSSEGIIGDSAIAPLEFDTVACDNPQIIHISGTVYAVIYVGSSSNHIVKTVSISDDGATLSVVDTWILDSGAGHYRTRIVHISGTVYAVWFGESTPNLKLGTFNIAADGTITKSFIDTLGYGTYGNYRSFLHHTGDYYIMVHDSKIETVTIASDGTIGAALTDTHTFNGNGAIGTSVIKLNDSSDPGYYAVFSRESVYPFDGTIITFSVSSVGIISSNIDDLKVSNDMYYNHSINISGNTRCWVESGPSNDGYVYTRSIDEEGDIGDDNTDGWEFDESQCNYPFIVHISGSIYLIVYQYVTSGAMKAITLDIATPSNVYPSDPMARVSSIRHIYRPGFYRMEVGLGDLGLDIDIAEAAIRRELEGDIEQEIGEPYIPKVPTIIKCPICLMDVLLEDWPNHLETYHPWLTGY